MLFSCGGQRENKRELRRQAILGAAADLFIEKGYEATTLSDVVRRSGGSLATLYEMFENKQGLLRALVSERCSALTETIQRAVSSHQAPREALREISDRMFDKILNPETVALVKAAVAHPDLGRQLYEAGPANGQAQVAAYLEQQAHDGTMVIDDPAAASQMFFQMMFGHFLQRLVFGLPLGVTDAEKEAHFELVLWAFFRIYGNAADQPEQFGC